MKVKATNEYKKRNLKAEELKRIPEEGEIFEIKNEKFQMLHGNNKYKAVFVEIVNESGQAENKNEVDNILNEDKEIKNDNEEENEVDKILNDNKELSNNKNSKGKNK